MQQSDDRCPHEHTAHHQFSRLGTAFRVAVKSGRVRSGARIITDNASSPALTRAASYYLVVRRSGSGIRCSSPVLPERIYTQKQTSRAGQRRRCQII
jgi:hypothetical protein